MGYTPYGHPPPGMWPGAGPGAGPGHAYGAGHARSLASLAETSTVATGAPDGDEDDVDSFFDWNVSVWDNDHIMVMTTNMSWLTTIIMATNNGMY